MYQSHLSIDVHRTVESQIGARERSHRTLPHTRIKHHRPVALMASGARNSLPLTTPSQSVVGLVCALQSDLQCNIQLASSYTASVELPSRA